MQKAALYCLPNGQAPPTHQNHFRPTRIAVPLGILFEKELLLWKVSQAQSQWKQHYSNSNMTDEFRT